MNELARPNEVAADAIQRALAHRFGETFPVDPQTAGLEALALLAGRRVHRKYLQRPVDAALLRLLCACALSAPSKSDLQQADILIVRDRIKHDIIADLLPEMPWVRDAPLFLVFLANGRRAPRVSALRGKPFPNHHLDMFFNASVDAAIVMTTFMRAAETVGLGCCPISVIRDHSATVSELLALPERVIPVAGMTLGWPAETGHISPRLPLAATVHEDRYDDRDFEQHVETYDRRRAAIHSYRQRDTARWGEVAFYGWSEDKARQYGVPQRADFGAFVRAKGFCLD
ncbi:MAG TPA: nitroreductase family protein [Xanthobacteraceae bacterium]|nr:nitroreductase family protein [Xanthobacteraceae bacterium]